jgi:poly [ADP-ribose] polymerase
MSAVLDKKYCKLIMVTSENNNKFYEMIYEGGPTFTCKYGRVELTSTTITKPIREWDSVYREKTRKGYKDVTEMVAVEVTDTTTKESTDSQYSEISIASVKKFIELMRSYTNDLVKKTYSVKAANVSKKQIEEAQRVLSELNDEDETDVKAINAKLIELYGIIPRFMSNVKSHILPSIDLKKALVQEQDNIDAIASQVLMIEADAKKKRGRKAKKAEEPAVEKPTFLEAMELDMIDATDSGKANFKYILDQLNGKKIEGIFEVSKTAEDLVFDEWLKTQPDQRTRYLIHGTRCTSVISILREGLKIRPSGNFQFSGKVYGDGNYFSEVTNKSLNYTGYVSDQILLVYEVHTGNPFTYEGWYRGNSFPLNYSELKKRGYDSTYVSAGNGLLNSEIIAYREEQARIKYIIWLKR